MKRGFTLAEVIVVLAIVAVLTSLIVFALLPLGRRKGMEARLTSDLHQIAAAMRIYMADYDDQYARTLEGLSAHVRGTPTEPPSGSARPECGTGYNSYVYLRNYSYTEGEKTYKATHPYDPQANPMVKTSLFCRVPGGRSNSIYFDRNGKEQKTSTEKLELLGVRLDGSVGWFDAVEPWEEEWVSKRRF